jgi:hypothetical protein
MKDEMIPLIPEALTGTISVMTNRFAYMLSQRTCPVGELKSNARSQTCRRDRDLHRLC